MKKRFTLKGLSPSVADDIDRDYPADLDTDRIFDRGYSRFLELQSICGGADGSGEFVSNLPVEVIQGRRRMTIFGLRTAGAIVCIAAAIGLFRSLWAMPMPDRTPPDVVVEITTTVCATTAATSEPTVISVPFQPEATQPQTSLQTTAVTTEPQPTEAEISEIEQTEADIDVTENAETNEIEPTTVSETTTAAPEPITEPSAPAPTDDRRDNRYGYFNFVPSSSIISSDSLIFVSFTSDDPEPEIFPPEIDGYTVALTKDETVRRYSVTDENGVYYTLTVSGRDSYIDTFDANTEWELEYLTINGRPAVFRRRARSKGGIATLYWDDGCHICTLTGMAVNREEMTEFACCSIG